MTANSPTLATVLVADDDEDILNLVSLRLELAGYRVTKASDGEQALAMALDEPPDLCLLDVMMPKLDGYGVTRALRDHAGTENVPVMLLTARVQESDDARGREAGADDYMRKPFSPAELDERVRAALAGST